MPWLKGQSGNPAGKSPQKPFADALRMAIAEAGGDHKVLRKIAANLLTFAQDNDPKVAMPAIMALADRMDGKVQSAQELQLEGHDGKQLTIRWQSD